MKGKVVILLLLIISQEINQVLSKCYGRERGPKNECLPVKSDTFQIHGVIVESRTSQRFRRQQAYSTGPPQISHFHVQPGLGGSIPISRLPNSIAPATFISSNQGPIMQERIPPQSLPVTAYNQRPNHNPDYDTNVSVPPPPAHNSNQNSPISQSQISPLPPQHPNSGQNPLPPPPGQDPLLPHQGPQDSQSPTNLNQNPNFPPLPQGSQSTQGPSNLSQNPNFPPLPQNPQGPGNPNFPPLPQGSQNPQGPGNPNQNPNFPPLPQGSQNPQGPGNPNQNPNFPPLPQGQPNPQFQSPQGLQPNPVPTDFLNPQFPQGGNNQGHIPPGPEQNFAPRGNGPTQGPVPGATGIQSRFPNPGVLIGNAAGDGSNFRTDTINGQNITNVGFGSDIHSGIGGVFSDAPNAKYYYPPKQRFPLPRCFYNPSGYVCCNIHLNTLMTETVTTLMKKPRFNSCNIGAISLAVQKEAERTFGTPFEAITALDDFAQKVHFSGDLVCKIEIDGKVILTYATPYHADSAKEPETVHHLHSLISKRRVQREALPVHSIRI